MDTTETGTVAVPCCVTAELANGFVAADPWSPSLDAILEWAALKERHGVEVLDFDVHRDGLKLEPLPLMRVGGDDDWYYACSSPFHCGQEHVSFFHRRFDDQHERYLDAGKRAKINTASGRYKNYRMPAVQRVADRVAWFAVGDAARLRVLLDGISHIGKKRAHGYGQVLRWVVEEAQTDQDVALWRELSITERPRPVSEVGSPAPDALVMRWGIRPPGWYQPHVRECVMPWSS